MGDTPLVSFYNINLINNKKKKKRDTLSEKSEVSELCHLRLLPSYLFFWGRGIDGSSISPSYLDFPKVLHYSAKLFESRFQRQEVSEVEINTSV